MSFVRLNSLKALLLAVSVSASIATAQVNLTTISLPAAQPGTAVTVGGTGFPSTLTNGANANVQVTITPPAGTLSGAVTTNVGNITGAGATRNIIFAIPPSMVVTSPTLCTITVQGINSLSFTTTTPESITIQPPSSLLSVTPGASQLGINGVQLTLNGQYTHFTSNTAVTLTLAQTGPPPTTITITEIAASTVFVNADQIKATFNIPNNVPTGAYTVTAKTGTETDVLPGGFLISPSGPLNLSSITPSSYAAGVTGQPVSVVGVSTHFVQGTTVASFGNGVTVVGGAAGVTVTDSTHANFNVTIDPITPLGARTLTITTGGEFATGNFTITSNGSSLQSVGTTAPAVCATACSGAQGSNATLQLTGLGTHWVTSGTTVSVGGGINVGNIVVSSPTSLTANISIGPGVSVGSYAVSATTNGETVGLNNAFSVTAATPFLSGIAPNSGAQGAASLNVVFTGVFTTFNVGSLSANFGPNITVNSVTPAAGAAGATSCTANITIASTAFTGGRSITLSSNGTNFNTSFTVTPSGAALTSVTPNANIQGASMALQVTGSNTHWAQGLTFATLGDGIIVNREIINAVNQTAEVDISIPTNASLGPTSLTMSTGGEIVTLSNAFTVLPSTPSLTMSPSSGMIPVAPAVQNTVNVTFSGNFTHFVNNSTIAAIDGNGVLIQNFKVLNGWTATGQFVIASNAPASPTLPCTNIYGGNHIVTLETPIATGSEIVETGFCVTSTPAVLTSISPFHSGEPVNNLQVTITGLYTHFESGLTTVGFGPNITVHPGSVNVTSATSLTAVIDIAANAVLGWRPVFVNTNDPAHFITNEDLTIGFAIDPPATATLVSVSPNTAIQGQSITVQIVGNLTNWSTGATTAIFGTGISVNSLVINGPASATAQISIDPVNAPLGGSSVTMVTQLPSGNEEVVSGPLFSVTQGISSIDHMGTTCNANGVYTTAVTCQQHGLTLYQGTITPTFEIFGNNTHWLQGETTLNFGSDIVVTQLTVVNPTYMTAQVAVSYTATTGYRGGVAITNAETAPSFNDALNVLQLQGVSVNIAPTSTQQGTTFDIQVNGTSTHWTSTAANPANNTTASFGNNNGVVVTGITVNSQTQMVLHMQVLGTAYIGPYTLTITTTGLPIGAPPLSPQSTEQSVLTNVFSVSPGAAIITSVNPTGGAQNTTGSIAVVGQNTSFDTGVTTAVFSTGGCTPATPAGINVTNVTASNLTHASLSIAVSPTAPTGFQTLCMYTGGETVSYSNAFQVTPGVATLNEVAVTGPPPATGNTAQQGQTVNVSILGQFTHWAQGTTTVTFGEGITVTNLVITGATSATATLIIDGDAYIGGRTTTVTTANEIVQGNFFSVTQSAAIITTITPTSANQGQHILMQINGFDTHWSQELTQFSISGGGYDIKVNGVVINSPTQAVADLSILTNSGNAGLGTRSISMSTVGENVSLQSGFLITGGVAAIASISPNYGTQGDSGDNVLITGIFTAWNGTTVVDFGDPCINVNNATTINSNFGITAVINIGAAGSACPATTGLHTVTVRTGVFPNQSIQLGQYTVYSKAAPPTPYISYEYPSVALVGQTLAVNFTGAYTNWLPGQTTISFGAGIQVNTVALQELDVTSPTSATANITILPNATVGPRTVTITTGGQQLQTTFYVTVGTPAITSVSTATATQGETRLLDLVGQYTTWNAGTTVFQFCAGITSVSNVQIFSTNAARVQVTVSPTANTGYCPVTATTGAEVANLGGGGSFAITPSTAYISSLTPNFAIQGSTGVIVNAVGFATLWNNTTVFNFGGGVHVTSQTVTDNTHAQLTLNLDLYATPGLYNLTAQTGGQIASLNNAFVVQPGTPILLSLTGASNQQQAGFSLGILGQYTNWSNANTVVTFPNGGVLNPLVNVTSAQSITVTGTVIPTAYPGCYPVQVTTTGQVPPVLTIYGFCVTAGPAAITTISPNNLGQGQSSVGPNFIQLTGTNTNWQSGVTVGTFGPGVTLNVLTINSKTSATAQITVAANANPEANTVTLTTGGETASDPSGFTILAATPITLDVFPNSGTQGQQNIDVCITSAFTHFVNGNTTADFGPGITINSVKTALPNPCNANDATHADVNISISPIAATTPGNTNHIRMITNLGGGGQEIAIWQDSSATTQYIFSIAAGGATISSATPTTPATVHQNDGGDVISIVGNGTHFLSATPNVAFCSGVSTVGQTVVDNTHITATVNVGTFAAVGFCGVTVTTGGEVAIGTNLFHVLAGVPVITSVNPSAEPQNAGNPTPISVNITGLYTHFTSGGLGFNFGAGVTFGAPVINSDTSVTVPISIDPAAAAGQRNVTVQDTTDVSITASNAFTVQPGIPQISSVLPANGPQGLTQNMVITGLYTHFSSGSLVQVSGTGVTVGTVSSPNNFTINVNFSVALGAPAGPRTVTVTSGAEVVSATNSFNVLPGSPNLSLLSPNYGVPPASGTSTVNVTITGVFTHFTNGFTTANFGPGISVGGGPFGGDGLLNVTDATDATAVLVIQATAPVTARTVTITTPAPPLASAESFMVPNGFTVQSTPATPSLIFLSPAMGLSGTVSATNVPINTSITAVFNEPMKSSTITSANAFISDSPCWGTSGLPATVGMDLSGRVLTITPTGYLAVGRTYYLNLNSYYVPSGTPTIQDATGTQNLGAVCQSFTTGFAQDATGPTFLTANIPAGASGVPTNAHVILGFDKPVNPATMSGLSVVATAGAVPVIGTWSYSTDFTQYIFTPAANLPTGTNFTVGYTNVLADSVGHQLTNPGSFTFTTGAGTDFTAPSIVSITPISNSTVATNPVLRFVTNKPMNPLTVTQMYMYNQVSGAVVNGVVTHSTDFKTWDLQLSAPLDAGTQWRFNSYSMYDWAGNCCVSFNQYFYTAGGTNVTGPSVLSVSPPNATTGIAVNAPVWVHFSEALDPTQVPANAITLNGGAVTGSISFGPGPDYTTLVFTPSPLMATSTTYNVAVSGLADTSGNPMTVFAGSSFTTAGSATADTTQGTVSITPSSGSTVPVNTQVVFQLSKPVDPVSINYLSMRVYDNTIGKDIAGTVAVSADLKTLTYTPTASCTAAAHCLPANHQICTWDYNGASLYDLSGDIFQATGLCFYTSNTADNIAPTVISVTPPDTTTGIGPNNPVVITFSKPINPGTIVNNVAMFNGSTLYTSSYNLSQDSTTVSFNPGNMPYATLLTVLASVNITDLAGNHLASESRTSFTTAPQPVVARPSVITLRPASGATAVPSSASVTFFTSAVMNTSTVNANTVHVSENGVLKTGNIIPSGGNQVFTFTPTTPFAAGALIQVWFTSGATDVSGNALYDFYASFTVASATCTTPAITAYGNGRYNYGQTANYLLNPAIEVQFCEAINPATVTLSSFVVTANSSTPGSGTAIPGAFTFLNNNTVVRFEPASDLTPGQYIAVQLTNAIKDPANNAFAGDGWWIYVQTAATHDGTPPFVTGMAPTTGATGIGTNALVSVTFSEDMDVLTLTPANVTLTGPGGNIPLSVSYNSSNFTMTVTPQAPLPAGANVALVLNGVSDYAGNALNPTPYNTSFNTAAGPDYNPPGLVLTSLLPNQSNVPLTSSFSVTFTKPIDLRTVVTNSSVYLQDVTLGYTNVPFTLSWSAGNSVVLLTPNPASGLLNVGHVYRVLLGSGFADLNGNVSTSWIVNQNFTTVLVAPGGGPVITQFVTPDGFTSVPENFKPEIQFDRPIQPGVLGGVTFVKTVGSVPVAMSAQLSGGGTLLTLVPNAVLAPSTQYTVTVTGVVDAAGNVMSGSQTHHFTTGPSIDLSQPVVISATPVSNATVGTNPLLKLAFNKPINPITATGFAIYQIGIGRYVNQTNLVWSADLKSVIFTYPGTLDPNDHFYFYLNGFADLAGNTNYSGTEYFYTSSAVDNSPLTVVSENPPSGALGVPANPAISIRLNKPAAPTSISNSSVTLVGVAGTTVSQSADGMTLSLTLPGLLANNTTYTIQVLGGAFTDNNGNAVSASSTTFTTSNAGGDTSHGGVTLTNPAPGTNGSPLNQVITVTFSKPYNPDSLLPNSLIVCIANNCANQIAGAVAQASANTLTFTPAVALPSNSTISVYVYPFTSYVTDLAGNPFDSPYLYGNAPGDFVTASTVDNTRPTVTNMTPAAGAVNVGPYAPVSLTFNKSLNASTVNASNFALYQGPNNLGASVTLSSDHRTVYLSVTLPFSATLTVTANTNVQDYAGNSMLNPYSASFNTEAQPLNFTPSVIQTRPGNSAPLNSKITIYTNSQINLSSAQTGLLVAQNGALIPGTASLTADLHGIIWTPSSNYQPNAFIEVWVTSAITDLNLNAMSSDYFTFTTQASACTAPAVTSYGNGISNYGQPANYLTNPVLEVQLCEPINPATVNSSSFVVTANSSTPGSGTPITTGTISFANNNSLIRWTPGADLATGQYTALELTSAIKDMANNALVPPGNGGFWIYIQTSAVHDNTPPAISSVTPDNGATNIGDNAPVRIVFNKLIDTLSANPSTVTLTGGANIPYTYTFGTINGTQTVMNITPLAALPDSTTINVHATTGITDLTGAAIPDSSSSFHTGAGGDFTGPVVVQQSIDNDNDTGVPTNSTFTLTFNKPLDPSTVSGNPSGGNTCCFFYQDNSQPGGTYYPPATANLSADQMTVTIVPGSFLTAGTAMYYFGRGATDQNGNVMSYFQQGFTTAGGTDVAPPTVTQTNPVAGATLAPTSTVPELIFNKPVRATSLNNITLNGAPVTAVLNNGVYTNDTVVKLIPPALLSPNTFYTVVATGVQDVAGNTLASPYTYSFTTGPNFNINAPNFLSATVTQDLPTPATVPLPQNTNVNGVLKTNPVFTFTWDQGIDFASLVESNAIWLTDSSNNHINVPLTFSYPSSPNQSTVQVQVNGTLNGSTQYKIWIYYNQQPVSLSGIHDYNQRSFPFTTEP